MRSTRYKRDSGNEPALTFASTRCVRWLVLAVALVLAAPAAAEAATVKLYFTQGEQLASVKRTTKTTGPVAAVRALLAGPTATVRAAGHGTLRGLDEPDARALPDAVVPGPTRRARS